MPSPKLVPLVLSDAERASLGALSRKRTASQSLAERARVVLACADEEGVAPLTRVAARTGMSRESVRKWRVRFMEGRMDALADEPRPGVPRTITDAQMEEVVVRTLERRPGATHWSKRELARQVGLSPTTVQRIWRAFGLKPLAGGGRSSCPPTRCSDQQGPRRRRPLPRSARERGGVLGGREAADPGLSGGRFGRPRQRVRERSAARRVVRGRIICRRYAAERDGC